MAKIKRFLSVVSGTFFGIGYFPVAPGTAATAVGALLAFMFKDNTGLYFSLVLILLCAGLLASGYLEKVLHQKDPGIVVIDEVVGIMIALAGISISVPVAICGFFLFRAFDMFKIYPINKLEAMPGGWGIMLDDCMAGLYTNIILNIAIRCSGI